MGMRRSDATFLDREVMPILSQLAAVSPQAREAADLLAERIMAADGADRQPADFRLNRWFHLCTETHDDGGWFATIEVDGHEIPYVSAIVFDDGPHAGHVTLYLDRRYNLDTTIEELGIWAGFLANAMAVSAGRTSHGEFSFIRNPHGRSGGGDPPVIAGTLLTSSNAVPATS